MLLNLPRRRGTSSRKIIAVQAQMWCQMHPLKSESKAERSLSPWVRAASSRNTILCRSSMKKRRTRRGAMGVRASTTETTWRLLTSPHRLLPRSPRSHSVTTRDDITVKLLLILYQLQPINAFSIVYKLIHQRLLVKGVKGIKFWSSC